MVRLRHDRDHPNRAVSLAVMWLILLVWAC